MASLRPKDHNNHHNYYLQFFTGNQPWFFIYYNMVSMVSEIYYHSTTQKSWEKPRVTQSVVALPNNRLNKAILNILASACRVILEGPASLGCVKNAACKSFNK